MSNSKKNFLGIINIKSLVIILFLSFFTTIFSVMYERLYWGGFRNSAQLPAGGFPLSFLYDPGTYTRIGKLDPGDIWDIGNLIIDWFFYFIICVILFFLYNKIKFKLSPRNRS